MQYTRVHICMYVCTHIYVCMYVQNLIEISNLLRFDSIYTSTHMYVLIYIYVYMYVCIYVCICILQLLNIVNEDSLLKILNKTKIHWKIHLKTIFSKLIPWTKLQKGSIALNCKVFFFFRRRFFLFRHCFIFFVKVFFFRFILIFIFVDPKASIFFSFLILHNTSIYIYIHILAYIYVQMILNALPLSF